MLIPESEDQVAVEAIDTSFSRWNFLHSFWSLGFVSLSSLAFNVLLTRILSVEDVGHIRVVRSVIEFAFYPACFGMSVAAGKFVADTRLTPTQRRATLNVAIQLALAGGSILAAAIFVLSWWPALLNDQAALAMLHWMIWLVPVVALCRTCTGHLQGRNRILALSIHQATRSLVMLILGVATIQWLGLTGWMVGIFTTEVTALAIALMLTKPDAPWNLSDEARSLRPRMMRFGGTISATHTLQALIVSVDVLCLDRFHHDPVLIAQYGMATMLFTATSLVPSSFIQSHFAKIAAHGHKREVHFRHFTWFFARGMAVILAGAVIGYFCTPAVVMIFGPDYARSGEILGWLIPAFVFQSAASLAGTFVINAGLARQHLFSVIASAVLIAVFCLLLIPPWGVAGAVGALTITYAARALLSIFILFLYRRGSREGFEIRAGD